MTSRWSSAGACGVDGVGPHRRPLARHSFPFLLLSRFVTFSHFLCSCLSYSNTDCDKATPCNASTLSTNTATPILQVSSGIPSNWPPAPTTRARLLRITSKFSKRPPRPSPSALVIRHAPRAYVLLMGSLSSVLLSIRAATRWSCG